MTKIDSWYNNVPIVQTKRLILRPFRTSDIKVLKPFFNDPEIYRFVGRKVSLLEQNPIQLFNKKIYNPRWEHILRWGIADRKTDQIIGEIMLYNINGISRCKIGCRICRAQWSKGYAKEATIGILSYLKRSRVFPIVEADVMKGNEASIRALTKSGFLLHDYVMQGRFAEIITDYYIYRVDYGRIP